MIDTSDKYNILQVWNYGEGHEAELAHLLSDIRRKGQGRDYDCILGLSGGLDSCYMLHLAVKSWGLRPYVLHMREVGYRTACKNDELGGDARDAEGIFQNRP